MGGILSTPFLLDREDKMTVSNVTRKVRYNGNGITTNFSYAFKIFANTDLEVYLVNDSTGVAVLQTLTTHYTVAINADSDGGSVTFVTPPPATEDVLIIRNLPTTQATDFPAVNPFPEQSMEDALDKLTLLIGELEESVERSIKFSDTSTSTGINVPEPEALKFIRWNATANGLENATPTVTTSGYSGAFDTGLDANKPASPTAGDLWFATDTGIFYRCITGGTWTAEFDLGGRRPITQTGHGLAVGDVVRFNGTNYIKAQADSQANSEVAGIVQQVPDANNFILALQGHITGLSGLTAGTLYYLDPSSAGALTGTKPTTAGQIVKPLLIATATTSGYFFNQAGTDAAIATADLPSGSIVQVVNVTDSAVATGTGVIPKDDTIPQNTEGDEYMTLAITPTNASNKLIIIAEFYGSVAVDGASTVVALFQDSTANALAAVDARLNFATNPSTSPMILRHFMTAGTASATTFKVRAGSSAAATTTFNGQSAGRLFGGVAASSITILEVAA